MGARCQLVDLVEHHHAVARAGLAQALHDVSRQGADVVAAVAADLGLVMHTPQRHAHEGPLQRSRNALAERGLADAGRPHEAEDGRAPLRVQLANSEELEDPLLDPLQSEVVRLEHAAGSGEVDRCLDRRCPRQLHHPVEVGSQHWVFARRVGHALQPPQFLTDVGLDVWRHARLGDRSVERADLGVVVAGLAQFILDRLQLLAKQELSLSVVELFLGALADLARQAQHFDAMRQQRQQLAHAPLHRYGFQQGLLLVHIRIDETRDDVCQRARAAGGLQRMDQLGRHTGQHRKQFHAAFAKLQRQRFSLGRRIGVLVHRLDARGQERIALDRRDDAKALRPLAHGLVQVLVGSYLLRAHMMDDLGQRADREQAIERRFVVARILLQDDAHCRIGGRCLIQRRDRLRPPDADRRQHVRKEYEVAHRDER